MFGFKFYVGSFSTTAIGFFFGLVAFLALWDHSEPGMGLLLWFCMIAPAAVMLVPVLTWISRAADQDDTKKRRRVGWIMYTLSPSTLLALPAIAYIVMAAYHFVVELWIS